MALAGLATLCQCSLLFDLGGLDNAGGSDAVAEVDADAGWFDAVANGDDARGVDAASENARDDAGIDAAGDVGSDAGRPEVGGDGPMGSYDAGADAAAVDAPADSGGLDAPAEAVADTGGLDAVDSSVGIDVGLVAFYPFDETSGTTSADVSGNGYTATMQGATFSPGLGASGNAATMNGSSQCVTLPSGIVMGLTSFSISAWVYPTTVVAHTRIFDFGTGTNTYMFLTPRGTGTRFAITTSGASAEQRIDANPLTAGSWQHVAVTLTGTTGTLYVNGAQVAQNTGMTLSPASLGVTTQNWLGRSEFAADPYLDGRVDEFRIYDRALSASEVLQIFQQQL